MHVVPRLWWLVALKRQIPFCGMLGLSKFDTLCIGAKKSYELLLLGVV